MDSLLSSSGRREGRLVDWSHPMNNNSTHLLPPKSPGGYSMFGGSSLFEGGSLFNNVHSSFPIRDGSSHHHKRTPSAGYLPQVQPSWLEEILESPDHGDMATVNKKGLHRRASSDSVAFSESLYNSDIMAGRFAADEERYSAQGGAPPGAHTLRIEIPDYNGWAFIYSLFGKHSFVRIWEMCLVCAICGPKVKVMHGCVNNCMYGAFLSLHSRWFICPMLLRVYRNSPVVFL